MQRIVRTVYPQAPLQGESAVGVDVYRAPSNTCSTCCSCGLQRCGRIVCADCSPDAMFVIINGSAYTGRACLDCFSGQFSVLDFRTGPIRAISRASATDTGNQPLSAIPVSQRVLPPVIRLDGDAFTYTGRSMHPGSTPSCGMFHRDGKVYMGKADVVDDFSIGLRNALSEMCSNDIYGFFGCRAQRLCISEQRWLPGSEIFADQYGMPHSGIHLMCEWITDLHMFDEILIESLQSASISVDLVITDAAGCRLLVKGMGVVLAVALLLNDIDCLGGRFKNVGYVIEADPTNKTRIARVVKIDPGFAFHLCDRHSFSTATNHYSQLVDSLRIISSFRIQYAPSLPPLAFDRLPMNVQSECLETLRDMFQLDRNTMRGWFRRPGFEALYPDDLGVGVRLQFLQDRLDTIRESYVRLLPQLPPTDRDSFPTTPDACLSFLKAKYNATAVLKDPITGATYPLSDRAVHLSLLRNRDSPGSLDDDTELSDDRYDRFQNIVDGVRGGKKTSIELTELLGMCKAQTKRINISGGAGYGKSTCCQVMVSQWASGKLFTEFNLVLWVPLRRLTSDRYSSGESHDIVDIIIRECLGVSGLNHRLRTVIAELYNPATTIWILDGYDEIAGRVPQQLSEAVNGMLAAPNRILTGRPQAMSGLSKRLDLQVEVAGFNDRDVLEFISRYLGIDAQTVKQHPFVTRLRDNRALWQLAHVPINLILLCNVLSGVDESDELTVTSVYCRIERLMMRRYYVRVHGSDDGTSGIDEDAIDLFVQPMLTVLSRIALQAVMRGVVVIPGDLIQSCFVGSVGWDQVLACGMLNQADSAVVSPGSAQYYFLHLTLQEFYAAKAVLSACQYNITSVLDWLRLHKYSFHLEMVWVFAAGLLSVLPDSDSALLSRYVILWLSEPRDVGRQQEPRLWLRMCDEGRLWECRDSHMVKLVSELNDVVTKALTSILTGECSSTQFVWFSTLGNCVRYLSQLIRSGPTLSTLLGSALTHDFSEVRSSALQLVVWFGIDSVRMLGLFDAVVCTIENELYGLRLVGLQCLLGFGPTFLRSECGVEWVQLHLDTARCDVGQAVVDMIVALGSDALSTPWVVKWVSAGFACPRVPWMVVAVLKGLGPYLHSCATVLDWLSRSVSSSGSVDFRLACDVLVSMGPALVHIPWISSWLTAFISSEAAIDVIVSMGQAALYFDWLHAWIRSIVCQPDIHAWKPALKVMHALGSTLLQFDWIPSWLSEALSSSSSSTCACALKVLSSAGTECFRHKTVTEAFIHTLESSSDLCILQSALRTAAQLRVDLLSLGLAPNILCDLLGKHNTRLLALDIAKLAAPTAWNDCIPEVSLALASCVTAGPEFVDVTLDWASTLPWELHGKPFACKSLENAIREQSVGATDTAAAVFQRFQAVIAADGDFAPLLQRAANISDSDMNSLSIAAIQCVASSGPVSLKHRWFLDWLGSAASGTHNVAVMTAVGAALCSIGPDVYTRPRLFSLLNSVLADKRPALILSLLGCIQSLAPFHPNVIAWLGRQTGSSAKSVRDKALTMVRSLALCDTFFPIEVVSANDFIALIAQTSAVSVSTEKYYAWTVLHVDSTSGRNALGVRTSNIADGMGTFQSKFVVQPEIDPVSRSLHTLELVRALNTQCMSLVSEMLSKFRWEESVHLAVWKKMLYLVRVDTDLVGCLPQLETALVRSMRCMIGSNLVQQACCAVISVLLPHWVVFPRPVFEQLLSAVDIHAKDGAVMTAVMTALTALGVQSVVEAMTARADSDALLIPACNFLVRMTCRFVCDIGVVVCIIPTVGVFDMLLDLLSHHPSLCSSYAGWSSW